MAGNAALLKKLELGLWLAVTQAGFSPDSLQTIQSERAHSLVNCRLGSSIGPTKSGG